MRVSVVLLAVTATISTGTLAQEVSPDSWKDAYSKRNVQLGITLEEFRKIPFPDPNDEYHYIVPAPKCSNDAIAEENFSMGFLTDLTDYDEVGAVKCGYYGKYTFMAAPYLKKEEERLDQMSPLLVDWAPDANYYFFKPDGADSYYLFHITTTTAGGNWPYGEIVSAFEGSLGQPTQRKSVDLQNAFGATITSTTSVWKNSVSEFRLVSNNGAVGNHTLDYELTPILNIVKAKLESSKKESRSRL